MCAIWTLLSKASQNTLWIHMHKYIQACMLVWFRAWMALCFCVKTFVWIYELPSISTDLHTYVSMWRLINTFFFILSVRYMDVRINLPDRHIYRPLHEGYSSGHFHMSLCSNCLFRWLLTYYPQQPLGLISLYLKITGLKNITAWKCHSPSSNSSSLSSWL